jgi:hypothetical protein
MTHLLIALLFVVLLGINLLFGLSVPHMTRLFLALFLILFGMSLLFGLSIPIWVTGLLALLAGVLLMLEHFRVQEGGRKQPDLQKQPDL